MLIIRNRLNLPAAGGAFFFFLLMLSLFSCDAPILLESQKSSAENPAKYNPDYEGRETKTFYATNTETNKAYTITAVHLAENDYCIVYGEPSAGISLERAEIIAGEFETGIYPAITGAFGDFREYLQDNDFGQYDKLTLFLLDIKDGYDAAANASYVAGYFYPYDLYRRTQRSSSNERALLYLDVNPGNIESGEFFTTIAHELQHLINHSIRIYQQNPEENKYASPQDTWVDEGLASAAEYLYSRQHIQDKIKYFNDDMGAPFSRGDTFFFWDSNYEDYCTVYLFFQWLRIQAEENPEIYKDIIKSEYLDYRAVTEAAAKYIDPQLDDWEKLLGYWLLANHVNAPKGSLLGYNGEITTRIRTLYSTRTSLAPGEGVFSYLDGTGFTPKGSGSHIRYLGVTQEGELIDAPEGSFPSGRTGRILTFNANEKVSAAGKERQKEQGYLTGKLDPSWTGGAREAVPARTPRPIDIPPAFFLE
ncbi:MAG: hypothetical protein LBP81_06560 [Treponema sp.]|jgi:hypothetical protein|nr:hypothetical protein [Treponema sp.]